MRVRTLIVLGGAVVAAACGGEPEPDPSESAEPPAQASEPSQTERPADGEVADGDRQDTDVCGAVERLEEVTEVADELTSTVWTADEPDVEQVRAYAESLRGLAAAFDDLAGELDERFTPLLDVPARSYDGIADLLAEVDYDLAAFDDTETAGRLGDVVLPDLDETTSDPALAEELAATVTDRCPHVDVTWLDPAAPEERTAGDPPALDGHAVSLAPAARERILDAGDLVVASFEADEAFPDPIPCPLWDPDRVAEALAGLVEAETQFAADIGARQHGPGEAWMFGCQTVSGGAARELEVRVGSPASELERRTDAEAAVFDGHAVWETSTTSTQGETVYIAFAVDADADLDLVARAGDPVLARTALATVLDDLADGGRP